MGQCYKAFSTCAEYASAEEAQDKFEDHLDKILYGIASFVAPATGVACLTTTLSKKKKKNSHTTGAGQAECICGWVTECRFFKRRQWLNGSFLAIDSLVVVRVVQTTLQCFCRAEKEHGFQLVDHVDFMKQAMVKHAITTKKQSTLLKTFAPK